MTDPRDVNKATSAPPANQTHRLNPAQLRRYAEETVTHEESLMTERLSPEEIRKMLHELNVHQIELEIQNEELRLAHAEMDTAKARYFDLYDLAPVGYCTVSEKGLILEANFTATNLLGVSRGGLIKQPFTRFIFKDDEDIFYLHRKKLFEAAEPQVCKLRMLKKDATSFWTRLEATLAYDSDGSPVCRVVMIDITMRKQAEEALENSNRVLKQLDILQAVMNGATNSHLVYLDRDFNLVRVNKAYAQTCGYRPEQMIGKNHFVLYPHAENEAIFTLVRDTGEPAAFHDKPFVFPDQPERGVTYWDWTLTPIKDPNGRVIGLVFSLFETTERKQVEEILTKRNDLLSGINTIFKEALTTETEEELAEACLKIAEEVTGSKFGFIGEIRQDGLLHDIAISNPGWEACAIYNPSAKRRRPLGNFHVHGIYGQVIRDRKSFFTNDPSTHPNRIGLPSGHPPLTSFLGAPLKSGDNTIGMIAVANRDGGYRRQEMEMLEVLAPVIVEAFMHKRAEEALLKSEARFKLLSETAEQLIKWKDVRAVINDLCMKTMAYLGCQVFFNYHVDDKAGRLHLNAYAGIPSEDAKKIEWLDYGESLSGCSARDKEPVIINNIPATDDPRAAWVKSQGIQAHACFPLMSKDAAIGTLSFGTRMRSSFSNEDLALMKRVADQVATAMERTRLVDELQQSRDELEVKVQERTTDLEKLNEALRRSNTALEDFAHMASHDLQEPLRKIRTFGDRLANMKTESMNDVERDYLVRMQQSAERMQGLIHDLLKYSRVKSTPEDFKVINLKVPVHEAVGDLSLVLEETEGHVDIGELPDIEANSNQMRQLFQNLIGNALKYNSSEKPLIRIYCCASSKEGFNEIHVEDNGIGFDEMYLDKIYKPFQRLHGRSSPYPGTGMGLAICRKIVEIHGGSITAKSEPGKGSTFIVRLPAKIKAMGE